MPPEDAAKVAAEAIRAGHDLEAHRAKTGEYTVVIVAPSSYPDTNRIRTPADYAEWS